MQEERNMHTNDTHVNLTKQISSALEAETTRRKWVNAALFWISHPQSKPATACAAHAAE